jgi:hypothetical protein
LLSIVVYNSILSLPLQSYDNFPKPQYFFLLNDDTFQLFRFYSPRSLNRSLHPTLALWGLLAPTRAANPSVF